MRLHRSCINSPSVPVQIFSSELPNVQESSARDTGLRDSDVRRQGAVPSELHVTQAFDALSSSALRNSSLFTVYISRSYL